MRALEKTENIREIEVLSGLFFLIKKGYRTGWDNKTAVCKEKGLESVGSRSCLGRS